MFIEDLKRKFGNDPQNLKRLLEIRERVLVEQQKDLDNQIAEIKQERYAIQIEVGKIDLEAEGKQ